MYPKTTKRVHVTLDMYPKRAKRVHVASDMYPKTLLRYGLDDLVVVARCEVVVRK